MKEDIKRVLFEEWVDDAFYANIAITRIEKRDPRAFERIDTEHSEDIDEDKLFTDIDKAVKYLGDLKKEGYTEIRQEWAGYENNYFVAVKVEKETDEEMYARFRKMIDSEVMEIEREEEAKEKKKAEIAELKAKIRKLEST